MTDIFSIVDFLNEPLDLSEDPSPDLGLSLRQEFSSPSASTWFLEQLRPQPSSNLGPQSTKSFAPAEIRQYQQTYEAVCAHLEGRQDFYAESLTPPKSQKLGWWPEEEFDISKYIKPIDESFLVPSSRQFLEETYFDHAKKRLNPLDAANYDYSEGQPLATIGGVLTILGKVGENSFILPPVAKAYEIYLAAPFFHTTISTALDLVWDISLVEAVQIYCSFEDKKDPSSFSPLCELNRYSPLDPLSYFPPNSAEHDRYYGYGSYLSLPTYDTPNYKLLLYYNSWE